MSLLSAATESMVVSLNIHHALFAINCTVQNPNGVTIFDVLRGIYAALCRSKCPTFAALLL